MPPILNANRSDKTPVRKSKGARSGPAVVAAGEGYRTFGEFLGKPARIVMESSKRTSKGPRQKKK